MFLDRLIATNAPLADLALSWEADATILPDTYVIDLDMVTRNASVMKKAADARGISLYFMLKQLGRNPLIGARLAELGLPGAVCVDFREALVMAEAGVPLGNVGHLVQAPRAALGRILAAHPQVMTVYSQEKAAEIGAEAERQGFVQPIMLRVLGPDDTLYSGQYGGFEMQSLSSAVDAIEHIGGVRVAGVCSFPCLLFSDATDELEPQPNAQTVREAAEFLEARGYENLQLNMPSASCAHSVPIVAALGGTHMEPGHGLSGTTPYHAVHPEEPEGVAYAYVSEVSHCLDDSSYCYGGGHYRRGHVHGALVGRSADTVRRVHVTPPTDESIDYHFELSGISPVGAPVLMCFRTQVFVTRSEVAIVSGISDGRPRLEGIFDALGHRLR